MAADDDVNASLNGVQPGTLGTTNIPLPWRPVYARARTVIGNILSRTPFNWPPSESPSTTSTYDQTYITIAQASLTSYANYLKQLTTKTNSQSERDRMSEYNRQVQLLISQIPYTQNTIDSAGTPQANQ